MGIRGLVRRTLENREDRRYRQRLRERQTVYGEWAAALEAGQPQRVDILEGTQDFQCQPVEIVNRDLPNGIFPDGAFSCTIGIAKLRHVVGTCHCLDFLGIGSDDVQFDACQPGAVNTYDLSRFLAAGKVMGRPRSASSAL